MYKETHNGPGLGRDTIVMPSRERAEEVDQAIHQAQVVRNRIGSLAEQLEERLQPVLRGDFPRAVPGSDQKPVMALPPLFSELQKATSDANVGIDRIENLLSRLAL